MNLSPAFQRPGATHTMRRVPKGTAERRRQTAALYAVAGCRCRVSAVPSWLPGGGVGSAPVC